MVPWRAIEYMIFRAFVFVGALLIGGAAMAQTGQVEIKDAWARATPGKAENGAAYLTIQSPVADRLVGVFSPVAKKAGLHTMTMEGSVMKMRPLGGVDLPAERAHLHDAARSEEHTSELQSQSNLVCRLL